MADFVVPEPLTFEQAISLSQSLLDQMAAGITGPEITSVLAKLVNSETAARGFFVTYLTDSRSLADTPSTPVVQALRSAPDLVAELLVKNLAMSAVMAVAHRHNQNEDAAAGSEQVQRRTIRLIELLQLPQVSEQAQKLQESVATGKGGYQVFLDRWGYDAEQKQVIQQALKQLGAWEQST